MSKTYPYPNLIAHRGAGKDAPENTLAAFRLGAHSGYLMFECDVKFSKDKTLFLHHDDNLERTTNAEGAANSKTWHELTQHDAGSWHSTHYAGEPLARFDTIINFVMSNDLQLDVEIKPNPGEEYATGVAVAKFLEGKVPFGLGAYPFLLSSFQPEALKGAMDTVPGIPRALLIDDWGNDEDAHFKIVEDLMCTGIITNYKIISANIVKRCHEAGHFVIVYTANEPEDIKYLFSIGVDSVITDNMTFLQEYMS